MPGAGGVKVEVAFSDATLEPNPTWDDITALRDNLVAGYDINRGREFELDFTDTGSYTVTVKDPVGILDPTNSSSPLYGTIEPDLQLRVSLWNPVAAEWSVRSRVWIDDFDYDLDPSQKINYLTIRCYDIFALLSTIQMQPGAFGDPPPGAPNARVDSVFFDNATFQDRIVQVLTNAGIDPAFYVVFTGNVNLLESIHSPGESPMEPIQMAVDGEFPGVSNDYVDRFGRFVAHGRLAKFDPQGTWEGISADLAVRNATWAWRHWKIGDGAAIVATPDTYAHLRPPFSWNRGRSKIINSALAYPKGIRDADIAGQLVEDAVSIGLRGYQSWSKENLLTESGILTGNDGNTETKLFGQFYVSNYAEPRNRVTALTCKSISPSHAAAAETWDMLCNADISDGVDVTVTHPGGGGFNLEPFFIEGVKETCEPLNGEFALVTASYDVSPQAYFTNPVGLDGA